MMALMARAATTSDAFNAIAEPQRRRILMLLKGARAAGERSGPRAAHHPAAGVQAPARAARGRAGASARRRASSACTRSTRAGCKPIHAWTGGFERFWNESFDRLNEYVKDLKQTRQEENRMAATGLDAPAQSATATARSSIARVISAPGTWCSRRSPT